MTRTRWCPFFALFFVWGPFLFFSNNFHIKVWFNKPYYCIVMYTKERKIETPPYQGKLGAILSLRWCLFVEKCCNSFRRLLFYYALLLVVLWPSKLFINYQMEFKLHKIEGLLKRNAQSGIIHSFKLLMKRYTEGGISMQKCFGFRTLLKQCKILLKLIFDRTVASCTVSSCHLARK